MKIILAFDSYKGCLTASEACKAARKGLLRKYHTAEVIEIPLSDGGEGLVQSISKYRPINIIHLKAHGPLMEDITAHYAISTDGETAYMEMSETSGLTLVPIENRNPLNTTTYGVGEMLYDAIHRGCKEIIMGIGGSATCDAGAGMLQALEDLSVDKNDFVWNSLTKDVNIIVACDVTNPLYGKKGAAYIFGPQKGAADSQLPILDERLRKFAKHTETLGLATELDAQKPGAGAAGGLGYALMAYLNAKLRSGIEIFLEIAQFDKKIGNAAMVITGEGCSDKQTLMGKVAYGVLQHATVQHVPVHLVSGTIKDKDKLLDAGFASVKSINENDNRPICLLMNPDVAKQNLTRTLETI